MSPESNPHYQDIALQIESIHKADQELRLQGRFDLAVDTENSAKIKAIYEQIGFPTISKVGASASHHFFTILQHSPDIEFKKAVLRDMYEFSAEEVNKRDVGYLDDRIRLAEGRKQRYGTQLTFNEEKQTYEVMDLEDPEFVNTRRAELGMNTLGEYLQYANKRRKEVFGSK